MTKSSLAEEDALEEEIFLMADCDKVEKEKRIRNSSWLMVENLTTEVLDLADLEGGTYYQCLGVGGQAYQGIRTSRQSQKAYPGLRPAPWRSPADDRSSSR